MCTLYRLNTSAGELATLFEAAPGVASAPPATDVYPRRTAYIVRGGGAGRTIDTMRWGFPPPAAAKAPVVNVRNLASPFWRTVLATPAQRCLVPVASFCEWEGPAGAKTRRWFSVRDRPVFAFAGVWRPVEDGAVFAFLTCEPNPLVAAIHPKAMPVILHESDHTTWLSGNADAARALAVPFPSQLMAVE